MLRKSRMLYVSSRAFCLYRLMDRSEKISELLDRLLPADGVGTEREKLRMALHNEIQILIGDKQRPKSYELALGYMGMDIKITVSGPGLEMERARGYVTEMFRSGLDGYVSMSGMIETTDNNKH